MTNRSNIPTTRKPWKYFNLYFFVWSSVLGTTFTMATKTTTIMANAQVSNSLKRHLPHHTRKISVDVPVPSSLLKEEEAAAAAPINIVVVGGGPAGLFFSLCYLTKHPNAYIQLYEKYPNDPRKVKKKKSQMSAFGFGLGARSIAIIKKNVPGLLERIVKDCGAPIPGGGYIVNRNDLCSTMLNVLERKFGKRFQVIFNAEAVLIGTMKDDDDNANNCKIDRDRRIMKHENCVHFKMGDGSIRQVPYELLVGADGRNSAIRQQLAKMGKLRVRQYFNHRYWKAMAFPRQSKASGISSNAFLRYNPSGREASDICLFLPKFRNEHMALMFWNRSSGNLNPFGGVKSAEEFKKGILECFPNLTNFPSDDEIEYVLNNQQVGTEMWMKVSEHAIPEMNVALIGDAAQSMYTRLGQGCTCGLQGASMLSDKLINNERKAGIIKEALKEFSMESRAEGHAISDLNLLSHWDSTKIVGRFGLWNPSSLFPLLGNMDVSYASIHRKMWLQVAICKILWFLQRIPV